MTAKKLSSTKTTQPTKDDHDSLLKILATIDRPVDFCVSRDREFVAGYGVECADSV